MPTQKDDFFRFFLLSETIGNTLECVYTSTSLENYWGTTEKVGYLFFIFYSTL